MRFLDSKYQMNTLEKSLKFKYVAVLWFYTLLGPPLDLFNLSRNSSSDAASILL